jgi:hypothetical protein
MDKIPTGFSEAELASRAIRVLALSSRASTCYHYEKSADENVQLPMIYAGIPKTNERLGAENFSQKFDSNTVGITDQMSFSAANANVLLLRAHW